MQPVSNRILILEDDPGILALQERALRRAGYGVTATSSMKQALERLQQERPDLIVLDYRLDGPETGLDFYRRLREQGRDLPAILVTGFSDEKRVLEALRAGVRDVVPKGSDYLDYLPEAVRRVLQQVQAEQQAREAERLRVLNAELENRVAARTVELRRRAEQLRRLAAQLTRVEQQERRRVAAILHDHLQQLLVGARFNLNIVLGQLPDASLQQLIQRIDELLDESLTTSRSLTVELSPPILYQGTFAAALQWLAHWMGDNQGLRIQVRIDEHADPKSEAVRVLLFQAVRELLFNVAKHAGTREASLSMAFDGDQVHIRVIDQGVGFDEQQRLQTATGFGLLSIRERLELLGGSMRIDSAPGRGTQVELTAPVEAPPSAPDAEMVTTAHAGDIAAGRPDHDDRIRVLLADDHAVVRDGLARLLKIQPDIQVIGQAADGAQAVEMAMHLRPDVVVMDVSMPQLDGIEATRRIRAELPATHIIGLSMHSEEAVAASMASAGAAAYLTKTSPPEHLLAAIRRGRSTEPATAG